MSRRHPDIEALLEGVASEIGGSCPCGDDCDYVLAECCDTHRPRCLTQAWSDMTVCHRGSGCNT